MTKDIMAYVIAFCFLVLGTVTALKTKHDSGDQLAKPDQFKYAVSIRNAQIHVCGGSLLADNIVLSAADCFHKDGILQGIYYEVLAGSNKMYPKLPSAQSDVSNIYIPLEYKQSNEFNDHNIAVLQLTKSLNIKNNPHLAALQLPEKHYIYSIDLHGEIATFGNGKSKAGPSDGFLHFGTMQVVAPPTPTSYRLIYGKAVQPANGTFKGICWGDSGSTIVKDNMALAIATLDVRGCGEEYLSLSVLTPVVLYVDFIKGAMQGEPIENTITYGQSVGALAKIGNWLLPIIEYFTMSFKNNLKGEPWQQTDTVVPY